jgi:hypothetical protein
MLLLMVGTPLVGVGDPLPAAPAGRAVPSQDNGNAAAPAAAPSTRYLRFRSIRTIPSIRSQWFSDWSIAVFFPEELMACLRVHPSFAGQIILH